MKNTKPIQRSPLALAVLALLAEAPMHPYRMQQLIKERGKDEVINVRQRANIYQTIERLQRDGLIAVRETLQEAGRPDRTVYEATEAGSALLRQWLRDMLAVPSEEFPDFPAAVSFLALLSAEEVREQLERRAAVLEDQIRHIAEAMETYKDIVPRLFMLESEYKAEVLSAELSWVRSVVRDIGRGALAWDEEWLREIAKRLDRQE
ncbi:PadR family transcriptional regulator [Paenibacillus filicis]|uniref:PadR family transcriptional regulator n=1 Tax=Paenibacillus gyeongsangnamensis TaxID=3388067 RepID=A0ABT4QC84_9BACL|nr:PadR family transcriptional regulator [Paenibacillus filicis]MCZ8514489.1 PadR family transcriptional regulator [Paenibacillus filicis]